MKKKFLLIVTLFVFFSVNLNSSYSQETGNPDPQECVYTIFDTIWVPISGSPLGGMIWFVWGCEQQ